MHSFTLKKEEAIENNLGAVNTQGVIMNPRQLGGFGPLGLLRRGKINTLSNCEITHG